MKIWHVRPDVKNYLSFFVEDEEKTKKLIDGKITEGKKVDEWVEVNLTISEEEECRTIADYSNIWYATREVVNQATKNILEAEFKDYIQFLPVHYNEDTYYIMHVFRAVDGVDYEKSIVERFFNGFIMSIEEYVFKDVMKEFPIAKVYQNKIVSRCSYFANDEFKNKVEEHNLTGFLFQEVYEF